METYLMALTGFIAVMYLFTEVRNYMERQKLLDRIMSRDYHEFTEAEVQKQKIKKPAAPRGVEI